MSPAAQFSTQIIKLGTRSFNQQMEAVSGKQYRVTQLARLNRDLETFYEKLYQLYPTITANEYRLFSTQLKLMLSVLKNLYTECRKLTKKCGFSSKETEKLWVNYSALYEIKSDIENFKLPSSGKTELLSILSDAGASLSKIER